MIETKDIYWLAGLMEGEGSFGLRSGLASKGSQPVLQLGMTDRDIVERARTVLRHGAAIYTVKPNGMHKKTAYKFVMVGPQAVGWMMILYALMGERRQACIRDTLAAWRESPAHGKWKRRKGYKRGELRAA